MLIFKHKDGGWYGAHFISKHKDPETREWYDVVTYQRLPVGLQPGENINKPYNRTLADFKANFTHYSVEEFQREGRYSVNSDEFFRFVTPRQIRFEDLED